jgi:hypothetical protein
MRENVGVVGRVEAALEDEEHEKGVARPEKEREPHPVFVCFFYIGHF